MPVIVSRRCGASYDLVEESDNGYTFDPFNVNEMADRMAHVAGMPKAELARMGQRSQEIISGFGPEQYAKGLSQAIRAAGGPPVRGAARAAGQPPVRGAGAGGPWSRRGR